MLRFYLIPVETINGWRGPKYFNWIMNTDGIVCQWGAMDYGFLPTMLLLADILQTDHDALILNTDVYSFPESLDDPISDPTIDAFFEGLHIPTDWLTPSTTYRELLRQTAGMFQFNQRYSGIAISFPLIQSSIFTVADTSITALDAGFDAYATIGMSVIVLDDALQPHLGHIGNATADTANVYMDSALTLPGWNNGTPETVLIFSVVSGINRSIFDNVALDDSYRDLLDYEKAWFDATVESFGYDPGIILPNVKFRSLVKTAGNYWADQPFYLMGLEF